MRITDRIGAVALCAVVLVVPSCGSTNDEKSVSTSTAVPASSTPSRLVGPSEFAAAIQEPTRVTINVHVPYEGDIPGTDLSIPFDEITRRAAELPIERTTPLAIYCRSGPMSAKAARELAELGYIDVVELQGGMRSWQASGRSLLGA